MEFEKPASTPPHEGTTKTSKCVHIYLTHFALANMCFARKPKTFSMLDAFIYDTSSVQDRLLQAVIQKEKQSLFDIDRAKKA